MRLSARSIPICLCLSVTWVAFVGCIVLYEYARYTPWCEYAGPLSTSSSCSPWLWNWYAKGELPKFIAETDASSATKLFLPRAGLLLTALFAGPLALWTVAVCRRGVRGKSKHLQLPA